MRGVTPPGGVWIGIAGLDLVRDPEGHFLVLEDNAMTPSGMAYAAAARGAVGATSRARPCRSTASRSCSAARSRRAPAGRGSPSC